MFQSATIVVGISPEEIAEAVRQVRASRAVDVAGDPIHQTAASAASLQDRAAGRFVRAAAMVAARFNGWDRSKVEDALSKMESERPWLDWLKDGGLEQIIAFIAALMKLFA